MTEKLELAITTTCTELSKEELIQLVVMLVDEGLHIAGRKKKEAE